MMEILQVWVGIGRDITMIKDAEEQILKLSMSIEQSPSTIVITDVDGNIEYVNPKFCEITGYSTEEAIGQNPRILSSGKIAVEVYQEMWNTIKSGEVWRGELLNKKKNGFILSFLLSICTQDSFRSAEN